MGQRTSASVTIFAVLFLALLPITGDSDARNSETVVPAKPSAARSSRGHSTSICGLRARIGMIDTIVEVSHPALKARRITQRSFLRAPSHQSAEHGTAVAALLVGEGGLLPDAELFVAAALEQKPDGSMRLQLTALLQALDWMAANGVKAVNISFEAEPNGVLGLILDRAAANGLVLMAAAGNGGPTDVPPYPAAHPSVIAVTAVDARMRVYRHANRGSYIDFAAPGVGVKTAGRHGWRRQSGTSFAVPYVTAAAALLLAAGVPPDNAAIRAAIAEQALDLGPVGRDNTYGWGFVNPRQAIDCASAS